MPAAWSRDSVLFRGFVFSWPTGGRSGLRILATGLSISTRTPDSSRELLKDRIRLIFCLRSALNNGTASMET